MCPCFEYMYNVYVICQGTLSFTYLVLVVLLCGGQLGNYATKQPTMWVDAAVGIQRTISMLLVRTVSFVMGLWLCPSWAFLHCWVNFYIFPILIFYWETSRRWTWFFRLLWFLVWLKPVNMCAADLTNLNFLPPEIKFTPIFLSTETFHDLARVLGWRHWPALDLWLWLSSNCSPAAVSIYGQQLEEDNAAELFWRKNVEAALIYYWH